MRAEGPRRNAERGTGCRAPWQPLRRVFPYFFFTVFFLGFGVLFFVAIRATSSPCWDRMSCCLLDLVDQ